MALPSKAPASITRRLAGSTSCQLSPARHSAQRISPSDGIVMLPGSSRVSSSSRCQPANCIPSFSGARSSGSGSPAETIYISSSVPSLTRARMAGLQYMPSCASAERSDMLLVCTAKGSARPEKAPASMRFTLSGKFRLSNSGSTFSGW